MAAVPVWLCAAAMVPTASADRGAYGYDAWRRAVADAGFEPESVIYPFAADPEMEAWAEEAVGARSGLDPLDALDRLQAAMFRDESFDFAYDEARTSTAAGAFRSRRGNCISFTALFVALSRSLGLPTRLMSVERVPQVERDGGLVVINRHVVAAVRSGTEVVVYDFNLSSEAPFGQRRFIDDVQASAMFHNNLGGTALREGDAPGAREHLEITTGLWPDWSVGWVNLGVTLSRLGDPMAALEAYNRALDVDPGNSSALNNMSFIYTQLGRDAEAETARRAAVRTTENPFTLITMADSEMMRGNLDEAGRYLRRARRWYPDEPEVYAALARLATYRGDLDRAARRMRKADRLRRSQDGGEGAGDP